jgi:hypothetical protein
LRVQVELEALLNVLVVGGSSDEWDPLADALARAGHHVSYARCRSDDVDDRWEPVKDVRTRHDDMLDALATDPNAMNELPGWAGPVNGVILGSFTELTALDEGPLVWCWRPRDQTIARSVRHQMGAPRGGERCPPTPLPP